MVEPMSLIHDVLNDLDRRQARKSAGPEIPAALQAPRPRSLPRWGAFILLGGGFLVVSAVFWWFYLPTSYETTARKLPVKAAPVAAELTPAVPDNQAIAPVLSRSPRSPQEGMATSSVNVPQSTLLHAPSRTDQNRSAPGSLERSAPQRRAHPAKTFAGARMIPFTHPRHQAVQSASIPGGSAWEDEKLRLAESLWQRGETTKALELLRESLRSAPRDIPLTLLEARLLAAQQQPGQALSLLRNLRPAPADSPDYFGMLGTLAQQQGDLHLAEDAYAHALTLAPDSLRWKTGMGITLALAGNDAARPYLKEALASVQPASPLADYLRALLAALH